jgi:hypothetical protein
MKSRMAILAVMSLFAAFVSKPAHVHGQQVSQSQQQDPHHPDGTTEPAGPGTADQQANMMNMMNMMSRMKATDTRLDELVKKMNAAKGSAKVDAIAEVVTALVEDRRTASEPMMGDMMSMMRMMNMMGGSGGRGTMPMTPQR